VGEFIFRVIFHGCRQLGRSFLNNVGFQSWFPTEQVFPEEDERFSATLKAVRYAHNRLAELNAKEPFTGAPELTPHSELYYLV
jgi:SulP family sulfate permease